MKKTKKVALGIIILSALFLLVPSAFIKAQQDSGSSPGSAASNTVSILNSQADLSPDGKVVNIKFTAKNTSQNYYSNLTWKFTVFRGGIATVSPGQKNGIVSQPSLLDYIVSDKTFNLAPNEEKEFASQYDISKLILEKDSNYSFRIKVVSRTDLTEYGSWTKSGISLGEEKKHIKIGGQLLVDGKPTPSLQGVNVDPKQILEANFSVDNLLPNSVKIRASVKTFRRIETLETVNEYFSDWTTLAGAGSSGASAKISLKLPNKDGIKPESYLTQIRFFDESGRQYVPEFDYRWVAIGLTGNIISATSKKDFYEKGDPIDLVVNVTGPADMLSVGYFTLTADFLNTNGKKIYSAGKSIEFKPNDDIKTINFSDVKFPSLKSPLIDKIVIELKNKDKLFSTYEIKFEKHSTEAGSYAKKSLKSGSGIQWRKVIVGTVIFLFLLAVLFIIFRKKLWKNKTIISCFLILLASFLFTKMAKAYCCGYTDVCNGWQQQVVGCNAYDWGVCIDPVYADVCTGWSQVCTGECCDDGVCNDPRGCNVNGICCSTPWPLNFGTYLHDQCAIGCGCQVCYVGFNLPIPPYITKNSNTSFTFSQRLETFKCFNAVDWDLNVNYEFCDGTTGTQQFQDYGDQTASGCSDGYCGPEEGAQAVYNDSSYTLNSTAPLKRVCVTNLVGYCQASHALNVTIPRNTCYDNSAACFANGVCGTSNGQSFCTVPTTNLCSAGTPSAVSGTGPWNWTCVGSGGGTTASCNASKSIVNGACTANHYNCSAGVLGSTAEYPNAWQWWCNGTCGGTNILCTEMKVPAACGSSNGQTVCAAPTTNLCSPGTPSAVSGTGPWTWTCTNSVITANCSAPKDTARNGACGTATSNPTCQPPSSNLCSVGSALPVTVNGTKWNWTCDGYCGGTPASCASDKNCQTNWKEVTP